MHSRSRTSQIVHSTRTGSWPLLVLCVVMGLAASGFAQCEGSKPERSWSVVLLKSAVESGWIGRPWATVCLDPALKGLTWRVEARTQAGGGVSARRGDVSIRVVYYPLLPGEPEDQVRVISLERVASDTKAARTTASSWLEAIGASDHQPISLSEATRGAVKSDGVKIFYSCFLKRNGERSNVTLELAFQQLLKLR